MNKDMAEDTVIGTIAAIKAQLYIEDDTQVATTLDWAVFRLIEYGFGEIAISLIHEVNILIEEYNSHRWGID